MTTTEIVITVICALLANEFCELSPWLARRLVSLAARRAYTDDVFAAMRAEEWSAVIDERPGKLFKLCTGIWFLLGATAIAGRRAATRHASQRLVWFGDALANFARFGYRSVALYQFLLGVAARLGSVNARALLAQLQELRGYPDQAILHYYVAFDLGKSEVWSRLGGLLEMIGLVDEAIAVYQRVVVAGGHLARAELVRLLDKQSRADEALDLLNDAQHSGFVLPKFVRDRMAVALGAAPHATEDLLTRRTTIHGNWGQGSGWVGCWNWTARFATRRTSTELTQPIYWLGID